MEYETIMRQWRQKRCRWEVHDVCGLNVHLWHRIRMGLRRIPTLSHRYPTRDEMMYIFLIHSIKDSNNTSTINIAIIKIFWHFCCHLCVTICIWYIGNYIYIYTIKHCSVKNTFSAEYGKTKNTITLFASYDSDIMQWDHTIPDSDFINLSRPEPWIRDQIETKASVYQKLQIFVTYVLHMAYHMVHNFWRSCRKQKWYCSMTNSLIKLIGFANRRTRLKSPEWWSINDIWSRNKMNLFTIQKCSSFTN